MTKHFSCGQDAMPESEKTLALMQLAGKLAHELNNIFTTVIGNVALLDETQTPGARTAIAEMRKGIERGIELSSNLEAFAGTQTLKRRHIDVNRTIEETMRPLSQSLLSGHDLSMSLSRPSAIILIDEEKLRACLFEIARNASRSMRGLGTLTIESRLLRDGKEVVEPNAHDEDVQEVEIVITDTGVGMTIEVAERAIDPMFSTQSARASAGWGLSRLAGFVRQSGGIMKLQSFPGLGTSVSLRLPVVAFSGE